MTLEKKADKPLVMIDHGSAPLLVTELAHTQHRARLTAVYNSTWYFGSIVAAWVTFGYVHGYLKGRVQVQGLTGPQDNTHEQQLGVAHPLYISSLSRFDPNYLYLDPT